MTHRLMIYTAVMRGKADKEQLRSLLGYLLTDASDDQIRASIIKMADDDPRNRGLERVTPVFLVEVEGAVELEPVSVN